ncbi:outer membrane PBP1 activator LpoA protein [Saccharothrix ecbatanensis]|uniref:Outer membrane PBP1 activator LpoA protein n=1 Tax=Saccharothrix ecbatanensis TaxID=1105145 RepID=A0A7W9M390_9PSEU|nr:hypothetical protein [Saccharothrix ecbatanensis]MBB5805767.1 outer membrane PBP1 activator LpoA protein [Saccharothrix ecbatanensis]
MRRLVLPVLAGLALAGCGDRQDTGSHPVLTIPTSAISEVQVVPKLSPQGKDVLEQAKRSGVKTVVLTVATERDKTDQVAAGLRRLGGTVEATDTTIGYVRVSVPVDLAEQVTAIEGISRVDVDEPLSNIDPTP